MIHPSSLYPGAVALLADRTPVTLIGWTVNTFGESAKATATVRMPSGEFEYVSSRDLYPAPITNGRAPVTQPWGRACSVGFAGRTW